MSKQDRASEGFITNGDVQIAFRDSATRGGDVVLSHGVFANLEYSEPLVGRLADRYRVVSYDLPGHGRSGTGPCNVRDHSGDLLALIEQLQLDQPFLVGISYGAFVALEVASRTPAVAGDVVNIDGPLVDRDDASNCPLVTEGGLNLRRPSGRPSPNAGTSGRVHLTSSLPG